MQLAYAYARHWDRICPAESADSTDSARSRLYALIDAPQLNNSNALHALIPSAAVVHLFADSFAKGATALSPWLVDVDEAFNADTQKHAALDVLCSAAPALSFLRSRLSLQALADHLRTLLIVDVDQDAFLLRIADTQTLRAAMRVVDPAQRSAMLAPLQAWWAVDQRGTLYGLHTLERADPAAPLPLKLTAAQFDALLDASATPIVAAHLRQTNPQFAQWSQPEQADFAERTITRARQAGFSTAEDLQAWCAAALRGGEQFDRHADLRFLIDGALSSNAGALAQAFASVDETTWQEARSIRAAANEPHAFEESNIR